MSNLMSKKTLFIGGLTLSTAIAALTAVTFIDPQASTASAQSVAERSSKATAKLSPDERAKLNISANTQDQLKEAQSAKDLEVLTYDQIKSQYKYVLPPDDKGPIDTKNLKKFLKYTNSDGATVILGLNNQDLPVLATVMMGDPNGDPAATSGNASFHVEGSHMKGDGEPEFGGSSTPVEVGPHTSVHN